MSKVFQACAEREYPKTHRRLHSKPLVWRRANIATVAALSSYHSDWIDEFYSMYNSGWIDDGAFSPVEVLQSLRRNSPNHSPLYFLILSLWGHMTVTDIILARILSIMFALLGFSMIFRLARDFVGPAAGIFALLLACSNAYNYYISYARMHARIPVRPGFVDIFARIRHRESAMALGAVWRTRSFSGDISDHAGRLSLNRIVEKPELAQDLSNRHCRFVAFLSVASGSVLGRLSALDCFF